MSDENTVHVNFSRPIPLFPLEGVTLFPQQVIPLHIFEPRYRQMVKEALDGAGLIAMAVFDGEGWKEQYHGRPRVRPAVCVGHIARHERLPDGRYNLLLQGVCRARILKELPADDQRLYRAAYLQPLGLEDGPADAPTLDDAIDTTLDDARERIATMLTEGPLSRLAAAEPVLEFLRNDEIPTKAILELVSVALAQEPALRYQLLAEPSAKARAGMLLAELSHLERLVRLAQQQRSEEWPKGMSWN